MASSFSPVRTTIGASGAAGVHAGQRVHAVAVGEGEIQQHDVGRLSREPRHTLRQAPDVDEVEASFHDVSQGLTQEADIPRIVLHEQDPDRVAIHHGNLRVAVANPRGNKFRPPWSSCMV